jgi:hypothetical protein
LQAHFEQALRYVEQQQQQQSSYRSASS